MNIAKIIAGLRVATEAADLYGRALEAANNGDEQAAEEYLSRVRARYADTRDAWDAAGE
jgi:hypothetical protein